MHFSHIQQTCNRCVKTRMVVENWNVNLNMTCIGNKGERKSLPFTCVRYWCSVSADHPAGCCSRALNVQIEWQHVLQLYMGQLGSVGMYVQSSTLHFFYFFVSARPEIEPLSSLHLWRLWHIDACATLRALPAAAAAAISTWDFQPSVKIKGSCLYHPLIRVKAIHIICSSAQIQLSPTHWKHWKLSLCCHLSIRTADLQVIHHRNSPRLRKLIGRLGEIQVVYTRQACLPIS